MTVFCWLQLKQQPRRRRRRRRKNSSMFVYWIILPLFGHLTPNCWPRPLGAQLCVRGVFTSSSVDVSMCGAPSPTGDWGRAAWLHWSHTRLLFTLGEVKGQVQVQNPPPPPGGSDSSAGRGGGGGGAEVSVTLNKSRRIKGSVQETCDKAFKKSSETSLHMFAAGTDRKDNFTLTGNKK